MVTRLLARWEHASEAAAAALEGVADQSAIAALLTPSGHVLRAPELLSVKVLRFRALRVPPEVTVEISIRAWRGPADPVYSTEQEVRRKHKLWWRLARQDSADVPWRLIDANVHPFHP